MQLAVGPALLCVSRQRLVISNVREYDLIIRGIIIDSSSINQRGQSLPPGIYSIRKFGSMYVCTYV
jgi:hypothetical protein